MTAKPRPRLAGVRPEEVKPRKPTILLFGPSGVGKSWFSLDWPDVYYIDVEGGATQPEYIHKLRASGGMYIGPDHGAGSFDFVMDQVHALATEKHNRKTLVIDSITKLFANEIAREAERLTDAGKKNEFGADKKPAVNYMRQMVAWIKRLDMNVILIAGEIPEWGADARGERTQIGQTFDCWPRLEYELDLAIQVIKTGPERRGRVRKTRLGAFPLADNFLFTYGEFAHLYGQKIIEAEAVPVDLATPEQVVEIGRLLEIVRLPEGTVEKWLAAADVTSWDEMPAERASKAIEHLKKLMTPTTENL